MQEMYSTKALASKMGVHPVTIHRWRKAKKIKALHIGRQFRYTEEQVAEFLANKEGK
jgi:excisionase family DNA binding protein